MNYREGAREKRKKVVSFAPSPSRRIGVVVGVIAALMFVPSWIITERDASFTCTRDASGNGTCEHVVRHALYSNRETFDARDVRAAKLEGVKGKNGKSYRVHVDVAGHDVILADFSMKDDRAIAARQIDTFAHDETARTLDARVEGQLAFMSLMVALTFALGAFVAIGSLRHYPRRRLVLDEESGLASLEKRRLGAWRTEWMTPLSEVRGAAMERSGKTWRVVVDTKTDGRVAVVEEAREYDPAIATVAEFMR